MQGAQQMIGPHFQELFARGLTIEEPWYSTSIEMEPAKRNSSLLELHIKVDFIEGSTFTESGGEERSKVHAT